MNASSGAAGSGMTIAERIADEWSVLRFADLPVAVVDHAKRCILDTLGVGVQGFDGEPSRILRGLIHERRGPAESTVLVSGERASCLDVTLVNGVMVRESDYMDRACFSQDSNLTFGHPCEAIPGVLAIGERERSNGPDVIAAVVVAYEFGNRFSYALGGNMEIAKLGWKHELRAPYIMAIAAGRLLRLTPRQMAHAMGIAGSFSVPLGILDHGGEQLTMARNLRFPYGAYTGIHAALLAGRGLEGPLRIFEGHHGFGESVARGTLDVERLLAPLPDWTILNTWIKCHAAEGRIHGPIEATLDIVRQHGIAPDDVAEVRIKLHPFAYPRTADPATRRHPRTKYSADQSTYYCVAVAIADRVVGPEQFDDAHLGDPVIHALSDRIHIEPDERLGRFIAPGVVDISTKTGERYHAEVMHPRGHPSRPMTDDDVEEKFRRLAGQWLPAERIDRVVDTVRRLEELDDIGKLLKLVTRSPDA